MDTSIKLLDCTLRDGTIRRRGQADFARARGEQRALLVRLVDCQSAALTFAVAAFKGRSARVVKA